MRKVITFASLEEAEARIACASYNDSLDAVLRHHEAFAGTPATVGTVDGYDSAAVLAAITSGIAVIPSDSPLRQIAEKAAELATSRCQYHTNRTLAQCVECVESDGVNSHYAEIVGERWPRTEKLTEKVLSFFLKAAHSVRTTKQVTGSPAIEPRTEAWTVAIGQDSDDSGAGYGMNADA